MKIAIIEDEPKIAESLKLILMEIDPSISVMKILSSVKSSVEWLRVNQSSCDLLFMDINLTDGLSFEIFNQSSYGETQDKASCVNYYTTHNAYPFDTLFCS